VDSIARSLANRSGYAILSLDYRLAPEHKYPAALDDVYEALLWVAGNAPRLGLEARSLAVGGDSSGANLAAAVALRCRDQGAPVLSFQLLVYPLLDRNFETESYRSYGDGSLSALSLADVTWFLDQYVNGPDELDLPFVSPLRASDLSRLPRTLLVCAEIDPLRDDSIEYARRLEHAGVPVELQVYKGMFHGFWRAAGVLAEAREAIDYSARRMREAREA
jgi:acetyl esterase